MMERATTSKEVFKFLKWSHHTQYHVTRIHCHPPASNTFHNTKNIHQTKNPLGKILLSLSRPAFLFFFCFTSAKAFFSSFVRQSINSSNLDECESAFRGDNYCFIPTQLSPRKLSVYFCLTIVLKSPIFSLLSITGLSFNTDDGITALIGDAFNGELFSVAVRLMLWE